jgi:hypothetical protein
MHRHRGWEVVLVLLLGIISVEAQWVMVGRAVAGRVQRMTQKSPGGGYDVATVVLAANSTGVYDAAIKTLKAHLEITITQQDSKKGTIQFRRGNMVAGLQITSLGDKLTQLVIASSASDTNAAGGASLVLDGVLRVCKEMKVECTVQAD